MLHVWVADDEDRVRRSILRILVDRKDVVIVGESATVGDTVAALQTHDVDLLLLDVQMHQGSGFDVIARVDPKDMPPVIFITAYDQYAVKAFEVAACDYLLKPFDEERLNRSINRARELIATKRDGVLPKQLEALIAVRAQRWPERLAIRSGERAEFIPTDSIHWIESADNYVILHCGTRQHLMTETLTALTAKLDPKRFVCIHRRRTVNIFKVVAITTMFSGSYQLELAGGFRITTGRLYKDEILKLLAG